MGAPFKMKGFSGFGNSPVKQKPENFNWTGSEEAKKSKILTKQEKLAKHKQKFSKFQSQINKGKKFVKNLKANNIVKAGGKRLLGTLGFMSGGALSATASDVRTKTEGEQIKDLLTKFNR